MVKIISSFKIFALGYLMIASKFGPYLYLPASDITSSNIVVVLRRGSVQSSSYQAGTMARTLRMSTRVG